MISLVNFFLALQVAREVLANKEIISTTIAFIPFQGPHQFFVIVRAKNTTSYICLYFFKPWIWYKLHRFWNRPYNIEIMIIPLVWTKIIMSLRIYRSRILLNFQSLDYTPSVLIYKTLTNLCFLRNWLNLGIKFVC